MAGLPLSPDPLFPGQAEEEKAPMGPPVPPAQTPESLGLTRVTPESVGLKTVSREDANNALYADKNKGLVGDLKVGGWHALDKTLLGIPGAISDYTSTDAEKKQWKALEDDHEAAKWVGSGLGVLTSGALTAGIGGATGVLAGAEALGASTAERLGGGALASRLAGAAAKQAALAAPKSVVDAATLHPQEALENFGIAVGLGIGFAGVGYGASKAAKAADGLVEKGVQKWNDFAEQSKGAIDSVVKDKALAPELKSILKDAGGAQAFNKFAQTKQLFVEGEDMLSKAQGLEQSLQSELKMAQTGQAHLFDGASTRAPEAIQQDLKAASSWVKFIQTAGTVGERPDMSNVVKGVGKTMFYAGLAKAAFAINPMLGAVTVAAKHGVVGELKDTAQEVIARRLSSAVQTAAADDIKAGIQSGIKTLTTEAEYAPPSLATAIQMLTGKEQSLTDFQKSVAADNSTMFQQAARTDKLLPPEAAQQFQQQYDSKKNYVQSILPKNPLAPDPLNPKQTWKPDRTQSAELADKLSVVADPSNVFKFLKDGTLNKNHIEALNICYPFWGQKLNAELMNVLNKNDSEADKVRGFLKTRRYQLALLQGGIDVPTAPASAPANEQNNYTSKSLSQNSLKNGLAPKSVQDRITQ